MLFRSGSLMRSLPGKWFGFQPGSDQSLLARLSIDTGLQHERARALVDYIGRAAERSGVTFDPDSLPSQADLKRLAAFAHANGQIELAIDLCAAAGGGDVRSKGLNVADLVRLALNTVKLMDAINAGAYRTLNIDNELFHVRSDSDEIEMHANSANKGIAAVVFPSVDLAKTNRFSCAIAVPMKEANPLRFRLELASLDRKHQWPVERVLRGGDVWQWEMEIPDRKSTRLNSSHIQKSRMPSSA